MTEQKKKVEKVIVSAKTSRKLKSYLSPMYTKDTVGYQAFGERKYGFHR